MKKLAKLFTILLVPLMVLLFIQCQEEPPTTVVENNPVKILFKDTSPSPNLSFPIVMTTPLPQIYEMVQALEQIPIYDDDGNIIGYEDGDPLFTKSGEPVMVFATDENGDYIPIPVTYSCTKPYGGDYLGLTGFEICWWVEADDPTTTDIVETHYESCEGHYTWLLANAPWYPHGPGYWVTDADGNVTNINTWQADYLLDESAESDCEDCPVGDPVRIEFIDWGNPLENINPIVGYRFPVEVALYTRVAPMTAYKMGCLEYMSSKDELFGTNTLTYESVFATVLTTKFQAWVIEPDGKRVDIVLEPAIGPSGKMNFASAGGGWIPTKVGLHQIYLRILDENIWMRDAIINNDEHYCMICGEMIDQLNWKKQDLTDIYYNQTHINVMVDAKTGNRPKSNK